MVLVPWAIDKIHLKVGEKIGTVSINAETVRITVWVQNPNGVDITQCENATEMAGLISQIPTMIQHLKWCRDVIMEQSENYYISIGMSNEELSNKLNSLSFLIN